MVHELIAESIVVSYRDRRVLSDVSLSCKTGEIVGLFGRNGSGKSTLLKVIFGSLKAENKYLSLDGVKVDQPFAFKNSVSFLPQHRFIPKYFTVKKAIDVFLDLDQSHLLLIDEYIVPILKMKIKTLSVGQLRYLEIRLLLALPSRFVLLDEPFSGLTPIVVDKIKRLIVRSSQSKGVVLVDHNSSAVLEITTKDYWLENGCLNLLKDKLYLYDYGGLL